MEHRDYMSKPFPKNIIIDPTGAFFKWKDLPYNKWAFWRSDNKYEVTRDYSVQLSFRPLKAIELEFFSISASGHLKIKKGYRWDGASGPTIDTISTMRASCIHDVLYQAMRLELLDRYEFKRLADKELASIMREDYHPENRAGEIWSDFRADYYEQAVIKAGWGACGGTKTDMIKGFLGLI
jgi:hypothetical protein